MSNFLIFFIVTMFVIVVIAHLFILRWVYLDTKSIGLLSWPWLLLVIFSNGFVGLVVYAIVRSTYLKKSDEMLCFHCRATIPADSKFCPNCGIANNSPEKIEREKAPIRLLIIGFIMIGICIIMGILFAVGMLCQHPLFGV